MLVLTRRRDGSVSYDLTMPSTKETDEDRDRRTLSAPVPHAPKRPSVVRVPFTVWSLRYEREIERATDHFEAMVRSLTKHEVVPGAMERMRDAFVERLYISSANARRDYRFFETQDD